VEVGPDWREGSALGSLLPQSVRGVIHARLSHLSAAASELVTAGAVLERGFGFESLVRVADLGEAEGLRGLDELIERRLLLEEGGDREEGLAPRYRDVTYSFSHEKIRQVAYTEGGKARRWVLHRKAFEVLEEGGAPAAELARHALAAGIAGPAFAYSVAAGDDAVEVFAVRDAIVHYERAREVLDEGQPAGGIEGSIPNLEHLYTQLGRAYELTEEREKARVAYEALLTFAREAGEARLEVVALNHLAVFLFHDESDIPKVRTILEEARRVAEKAGLADVLAETECNFADIEGLRTGDFERSWPPVEKALASARALERPDLVARALTALVRLKCFAGRLEEAAAHAEEGAKLSRGLAELPAAGRAALPSLLAGVAGLSASWRAGAKAMEIRCLDFLAHIRIYQGRPQEGMAIGREVEDISGEMPERMEAIRSWAIATALLDAGEYEEALALTKAALEQGRKMRNAYLLGSNLGRLGEVYEALMNLKEARAAYEEAVNQGHYRVYSHARFCVVAALSEDWEEANAHARKAYEVGAFYNPLLSIHLHRGVEALLRGGDEELAREEVSRFAQRAKTNRRDRMTHLRALAVLEEWEGDTQKALGRLRKAEALAEEIGLPGELWQMRAKIGELHERRGEVGEAWQAFSRAAQTLRMLAQKIEDEELRELFLSAPRVHRVLGRD
jgi:tetratricopeptide (TPR) repeat protein